MNEIAATLGERWFRRKTLRDTPSADSWQRRVDSSKRRWRPWERSTGPRTVEGKLRSSRNAYRDGTRALMRQLNALLREQAKFFGI